MKKLLSSLSSMVIVGATVSGMAACSTKEHNNQHKNANGDSIWAWIPGIAGGKEITSPDIWSVLENPFIEAGNGKWTDDPNQWDGPTKIKMSVQLMQILSVAILANPDKFIPENTTIKIADYKNLIEILKKQWNLLRTSTNNAVEKKKESFKDSDKKNWEKKYHEFLDSNYKDITGASGSEKYRIEEQNYKAAIMTTGADGGTSAAQMLNNIILNNNMRVYKQNTTESSVNFLINFANEIKKGTQAKDWNSNNQNLRNQLALSFTWDQATNTFGKELSELTIGEIDSRLDKIAADLKTPEINYDYKVYMLKHPPVATPVFDNSSKDSIVTPALSETFDVGQFSLFQKYPIEKWFQNEKPLAISKITYAFKSGATPIDTGFAIDNFDETTQKQINNDLSKLASAKSWEDFTNNSEGTATASADLLTLSTQGDAVKSNILKASVYDSIGAKGEIPAANIDEVVAKINRKENNSPISANWKLGNTVNDIVISFFDTNGLNLVHIDGHEYLEAATATTYDKYTDNWQFKSLNYSSITYSTMTDKSGIMTTDKNKQMMNTQFSNAQYLWYLVNRSLVNSNSNSKLKFNVLDEVKKYATLNSGSGSTDDKTWWWWIFDFFNNFNSKILGNNPSSEEWLKKFITFNENNPNDDKKNNNSADWFISIINAMSSNLAGGTAQRLYSSFEAENKTIAGYKNSGPAAQIKAKPIVDKINEAKEWDEKVDDIPATAFSSADGTTWLAQTPPITTDPKKHYTNTGGRR